MIRQAESPSFMPRGLKQVFILRITRQNKIQSSIKQIGARLDKKRNSSEQNLFLQAKGKMSDKRHDKHAKGLILFLFFLFVVVVDCFLAPFVVMIVIK
jgi:hypothetical protein